MASICLYDIDFHHSPKFVPNLELMKVFNYYYERGDVVVFGTPKDNFDRFNQVIFFKNGQNVIIPKSLSLIGENKQIYGYGFYHKFTPLKPQYAEQKLNYLPYELNLDKIKNISLYNSFKSNSYVRVENNDMIDFKPNASTIYIADENTFYVPQMENFCKQYKSKYNLQFVHAPIFKDEETFEKFFGLAIRNKIRAVVDFKFSTNFFKKYYYENVLFRGKPFSNEKNYSCFLRRIITMILWAKSENRSITFARHNFNSLEKQDNPILNFYIPLLNWSQNKQTIAVPPYNYLCKEFGHEYVDMLLDDQRKLRLLLKQNPTIFSTQNVDFFNNI